MITRVEAEQVVLRGNTLAETSGEADWELGSILYRIQTEEIDANSTSQKGPFPFYTAFGYKSWYEMADAEFGLSWVMARKLSVVWMQFNVGEFKGLWKREQLLPIAKMELVGRLAEPNTLQKWLRKAEDMTIRDLEEELRVDGSRSSAMSLGGPRFTARLRDSHQYEVVNNAMSLACAVSGESKHGDLLTHICEFYITANARKKRVPTSKERARPRPS